MSFLSFIPIAGLLSGIIALLLLFILLRRARRRERGLTVYITNILGIILLTLLSSTLLLIYTSFKNYEHFGYKENVLTIVCQLKEVDWFVIELISEDRNKEKSRFYRLTGQQFLIEGHIVKWKDFFAFLGMKPLYQVTRLSGRYITIEDEKKNERTIYEINKTTKFWNFMMRYGKKIPGIDAVYGTASFTYPEVDDTLELLITHTGFMIQ